MRTLHHQTQEAPFSCMATCLAILTGRNAAAVDAEFSNDYANRRTNIPAFLGIYGIQCLPHFSADLHYMEYGKVYLATVPSLMTAGLFHQIVVDTRDNNIEVFDPAKGYSKTTQFYTCNGSLELDCDSEFYNRLAFPMLTFIIDYEIILPEGV